MQQTIVSIESLVQLKRQENVVATADQKSFQNELDILRYENMTSSVSLLKKNNKHSASVSKLRERTDSLKKMQEQVEATKSKLTQEKKSKVTQEEAVKELEDLLMHHEKELKKAENNIQGLNDQMFKESQNLAELRRVESNLITDIKSSQVRLYNILLTILLQQLSIIAVQSLKNGSKFIIIGVIFYLYRHI